jgi:hypothetical protein
MDISTANFFILNFTQVFFICFSVAGVVYLAILAFRRLSGI